MLMMLALLDPEQGAVVSTGAGGKGNMVKVLGAWVGGEDEPPLDEEFSDKVTFMIFELVIILLFPLSLTPVSWLLTCPLV